MSGHIIFSALFGAGVGWARESTAYGTVRKVAVVVGTFLLGLAAHSMFNAFGPYAVAAFASVAGWGPTVTVLQLWVLSMLEVLSTYGWAYVVLGYILVQKWIPGASRHPEMSFGMNSRQVHPRASIPLSMPRVMENASDSLAVPSRVAEAGPGTEPTCLPTRRGETRRR